MEVIVSCPCRLWTAADMERLVERLEKAVERLETVCQGSGMCGDASGKGEAQGSARSCAELAQGTLWGSEAASGGCARCPGKIKTLWLQHLLSSRLSLLQVGGAAQGCGSLWDAPGDLCALFFPHRGGSVRAGFRCPPGRAGGRVHQDQQRSWWGCAEARKHSCSPSALELLPVLRAGRGQVCCQSLHPSSTVIPGSF